MNTLTSAESYALSARMGVHEVVRELIASLGPTLVAALAGATDRERPILWAKPEGPVPGTENFKRLLLAHAEWRRIAAAEDEDIARAFFIGGNPLLRDDTLITAIREDRTEEVAAAVSSFVKGGGFW